jgi:hypothetical protein
MSCPPGDEYWRRSIYSRNTKEDDDVVYIVTEYNEIDCHHRPKTIIENLGIFRKYDSAEKCLVKAYIDAYIYNEWHDESEWYGISVREIAGKEWNRIHGRGDVPLISEIALFFKKYGKKLWEPEYIDEATYRVVITKSQLQS